MFLPIASPVAATEITRGKELQQVKREAAWSPDKQYKVENIPYLSRLQDGHIGHLFLVRKGVRKRLPVKLEDANGYDHVVEVLWAPNSRAFAVNLWDPGLTARSYLYDVNDLGHRIDIEERFKHLINDKYQKGFFNYAASTIGPKVLAVKWINSGWIEIHLEDTKELGSSSAEIKDFLLTYRWNLKDKLIFEPGKADKTYLVPASPP